MKFNFIFIFLLVTFTSNVFSLKLRVIDDKGNYVGETEFNENDNKSDILNKINGSNNNYNEFVFAFKINNKHTKYLTLNSGATLKQHSKYFENYKEDRVHVIVACL